MLIKMICALNFYICRAFGWRFTGERPAEDKIMILGAPHTSNFDYFLTLGLMHYYRVPLRYLIKDVFFKGPWAPLFRSLGGIPVDRSQAHNLVDSIVNTIKAQDRMAIGVLPEGTRKKMDGWKSGFYYIAHGAGIPIYPARVDGPNKTLFMGPKILTTGDIDKDMELLAAFFGDVKGVVPENTSPVRIRSKKRTEPTSAQTE